MPFSKLQPDAVVLIVAPVQADAAMLVEFLRSNGISARSFGSVAEAGTEIRRDSTSALVVAEEALSRTAVHAIRNALDDLPPWNDLPLLVLVGGGVESIETRQRDEDRLPLPNATLVEWPVRPATLLATIRFALRARARQYAARAHEEQRRVAEDALRKSEKLAVAGRLAASIAHEINNPLESITNLLYLIRTSKSLEEIGEFSAMAESELRRVSEITTQTLRFYRQKTHATNVEIAEIIDSVLKLYSGRLSLSGVEVKKRMRCTGPLLAYSGELRQFASNLVSNALDSMQAGGSLHIRLRAAKVGNRKGFRLTVADTGQGMTGEVQKKLFEPFMTTKGETGTGLGLWVSAEIIRKHEGHLRFRSSTHETKHGTVFSVFLPSRDRVEPSQPTLQQMAS